MLFQLNGKVIKELPKGLEYKRIVHVPDKLINFITEEDKDETADFWLSPKLIFPIIFKLLRNLGRWSHMALVRQNGELKVYMNGEPLIKKEKDNG